MNCRDRDNDLLLYGLGELTMLQRWKVARHLRGCARCRARQQELSALSVRIGEALRPPAGGGTGGGPGAPLPARTALSGFSALFVVLVLSVVLITVGTLWYVRSHAMPAHARVDDGCRPGLPNDLCR